MRFQSLGLKTFYKDKDREAYYRANNLDLSSLESYQEEVFQDLDSEDNSEITATELEKLKLSFENSRNPNALEVQEFIQDINESI